MRAEDSTGRHKHGSCDHCTASFISHFLQHSHLFPKSPSVPLWDTATHSRPVSWASRLHLQTMSKGNQSDRFTDQVNLLSPLLKIPQWLLTSPLIKTHILLIEFSSRPSITQYCLSPQPPGDSDPPCSSSPAPAVFWFFRFPTRVWVLS